MTVKECKEKFKRNGPILKLSDYLQDLNQLEKELKQCDDYTNWLHDLETEIKPVTAYTDGINYYILEE